MCASYGLDPRFKETRSNVSAGDRDIIRWLENWAAETGGQAKITGPRALNLNPLIREDESGRRVDLAWWWLWRDGSGKLPYAAFNARDDKLLRNWKWLYASPGARSVVAATSFVEKGQSIGLDGELLWLAALHNVVETDDGPLTTYALVTQDMPAQLAHVHTRMPLVLDEDALDDWLDPATPGTAGLLDATLGRSRGITAQLRVV